MTTIHQLRIATAAALMFTATSTSAWAISCNGNFQVQKSGVEIATPYCEDNNLAVVARSYGIRVSADAIRNNPSVKEKVCQIAGDDNRVRDTCAPFVNSPLNDDHPDR